MSPAMIHLEHVLKECVDEAVHVLVVSDGAVDDKARTVQEAERIAVGLRGRVAPISVSLVQLMTSTHAEPDTRAMTCVGSLNTAGRVR
jgi:hypothetical protein